MNIDKPAEQNAHDDLRMLLGGYLLGGLDEADTERLDAHLLDCDRCRAELDRLAPIPELLQRLPDATGADGRRGGVRVPLAARPTAARIEGLLARMRTERSRDRRVARVRWLAAAAVVLIAAVIGYGVVTTDRTDAPPQVLPSQQLITAQFEPAAGSGLSGQAVLTGKTWGVSIDLDLSRLQGPAPFYCKVRSANGDTEQAAVWGRTPGGHVRVPGSTSFPMTAISSISINDREGHVLGTASMD